MNKMQMAHDMALELVKIKPSLSAWQIADRCFEYADAMQAEADKRINKERPDVLNMADSPQLEWQPDWSQAPKWANWWAIRGDLGVALWCTNKPTVTDDCLLSHGGCVPAPNFGFKGTHLVERPQ